MHWPKCSDQNSKDEDTNSNKAWKIKKKKQSSIHMINEIYVRYNYYRFGGNKIHFSADVV